MFKTGLEKKLFLSYLVLGIGLNITGGAHADYQNQNRGNTSYYNETTTSVSDQDLAKKIRDKIGGGWFSKGYDQVVVQVNNGVVTLQGSVKTFEDKEKVEKEVRNIEGVRSVNSQISVMEPKTKDSKQKEFPKDRYATSSDDQLNKKIRDNVSRGWLWDSYKDVSLNTSNGVVTLEGTVDSVKDEQKLINEVQKIDGVRSVRSNLTIKNR